MLPAPLSAFVGRSGERTAVAIAMARHRLVTVVGPGGSGKSRLSVEAARDAPHPILGFVELASVAPEAPLHLAVLSGCGVRDDPGVAPPARLAAHLGDLAGLLVLDDCEHLRAEVAALLGDLLPRCPSVRVLATSRVALGVTGEAVVPLGGLPPDDAAALFLDRARLVQPGLPDHPDLVREICRLADGLPLAVELAAAHARALPVAAIRDGMVDRLVFLTTRDPEAPGPHRSLAATLDRSAELVGDTARRALSALSVVEGRFPAEVALALADRESVEKLVEHSLVQFDAADGRYLLLDTVREYARAHAVDRADRRLLDWAVGFAQEVREGLERADPAALLRADACDAAVASALDRAVAAERGDDGARVAADLTFAWSLRGRCADGSARVERLVDGIGPVPPRLRWAQAFLAVYGGEMERGYALAVVAAEESADDDGSRARALTLQGLVLQFGDPAAAEEIVREAAVLAARAGDDWCRVEALQMLAYTHLFRAALPAALAAADAAVPALERLGHPQLRAWDAAIRADAAAGAGCFADAESWGRTGLDLAVATGEPVSAVGALFPLLRALVAVGRAGEGEALLDGHRAFFASHPGAVVAESLALAGALVGSAADPDTAAATAEAALEHARNLGQAFHAGEAAAHLAVARLRRGDEAGAREAASEADVWAGRLGHRGLACHATFVAAAAGRGGGGPVDPYPALAEAARLGLRPLVGDGLAVTAALAADAGRTVVAGRLAAAAGRLLTELGAEPSPLVRRLAADARPEDDALAWQDAVAYALRSRGRRARPRTGWESLTPTEREVVALAAQGLTNGAIGTRLLITTGTVRTHLRSVFGKLGMSSRTELAAQAVRHGL